MSRKPSKDTPVIDQSLRERAEKLLLANPDGLTATSDSDIRALVYELNVRQIELEIQNEELREAQFELAETRDRYADLYEFAPVAYISLKKNDGIISANLTAAGMLGVTRQELLGAKLSKFIAPSSQDEYYLCRQAAFSSGTKQTCEVKMHKADATMLDVRMESIVFGQKREKICQTVLVDITQRKKAEHELECLLGSLEQQVNQRTRQLQEEHRFIDTILENTPAAIMVLDVDGRVIAFNKACEVASGYTFEEMKGSLNWKNLVQPDEIEGIDDIVRSLNEGTCDFIKNENHWVHKDGSRRLFNWYNTVLKDAAGRVQYLIGCGLDITAQRKAENQVNRHLEEAARLQRMLTANELGTFLAHELNQPLAAISMNAETGRAILEQSKTYHHHDSELIKNLKDISDQAMRGGEIVHGLLRLVKKSEFDVVKLDLNAVVRTACDLMYNKAKSRKIQLKHDLEQTLPPVLGTSVHIEQVLLNLLFNAIDVICDSGTQNGQICIKSSTHERMALVTVRDNGGGINEKAIDNIFNAFYSTKDYGLGVGLRISQKLVKAMDGRLWAEVHPSHGIFHLELPLAP